MNKFEKKIRIFSALEVANICGVVNQTAINWIRSGHLKAFNTPGGQYRVYAEDLMTFLDSRGMRIPEELTSFILEDVDWATLVIVDDDVDLNNILKRYIEKKFPEIKVYQAFDGFEAGKLLVERRPGFVILDIDLPGINGVKICRKIKSGDYFGKPFIISITGYSSETEKEEMLAEGVDGFFNKPLDFDALLKSIELLYEKVRV